MSDFIIERGIPLTDIVQKGASSAGALKYPFPDMEIMDSFDLGDIPPIRVRAAARNHTDNHGKYFTVRLTPDGSYRCWRIAKPL
jgi:hypothetical protein